MGSPKDRYKMIEALVKEHAIEDQATLVQLLKEHFNLQTNQVQVSRDLRRIGIGKRKLGEKMIYDLPKTDSVLEILRLAIVEVAHNGSMIVVKTVPALADFVGDYLDAQEELDILGTLAGENILFITPKSVETIEQAYKEVCKVLHYKESIK